MVTDLVVFTTAFYEMPSACQAGQEPLEIPRLLTDGLEEQ